MMETRYSENSEQPPAGLLRGCAGSRAAESAPLGAVDFSDAETRARLSRGSSEAAIYQMVERAMRGRVRQALTLIDLGCGTGGLFRYFAQRSGFFSRYLGVDTVRYEDFPPNVSFLTADLNAACVALPDATADVAVAIETIEHLENPRAFVRELVRLVRPGGWVAITTPNQLSLSSLASLISRKEFAHFRSDGLGGYPAHISALLETDLVKIARENSLLEIEVEYSNRGRIPLTARHWPAFLGGRLFSDNLLLVARKPSLPDQNSPEMIACDRSGSSSE